MNILCMEDDAGLAHLVKMTLERENFSVTWVTNGQEGLELLKTDAFDVALVDHEMPTFTGLEVIQRANLLENKPALIMITGNGNEEVAVQAMQLGADDYLVKDSTLVYLKMLPSVIEQVIQERQLKQAHEEARIALRIEKERSRIMSQFIQDASHEFKTPLSVINTKLYLLSRMIEDDKAKSHVEVIQEQTQSIQVLVDGLMTLSRLDNINELNTVETNLNSLIQEQVVQRQSKIDEKRISTHFDLVPEKCTANVSPDYFVEALNAVLDNAIRYSKPNGNISICTSREEAVAVIKIQDDGIGMDQEQVSKIFERMYRHDIAHTTRGFGLGLPIAARIIDLHYGEITVDSELDVGTTVKIALPVE